MAQFGLMGQRTELVMDIDPAQLPSRELSRAADGSATATDTVGDGAEFSWYFVRRAEAAEVCRYHNAGTCPDCGYGMIKHGACLHCPSCGYSSCGA